LQEPVERVGGVCVAATQAFGWSRPPYECDR
jgi:hypothetical protein